MRNHWALMICGSALALASCSKTPDCDTTEMRSAAYETLQAVNSLCGSMSASNNSAISSLGSACTEDAMKTIQGSVPEDEFQCILHNIKRIQSRELPMP
jgi:hypothetical protein